MFVRFQTNYSFSDWFSNAQLLKLNEDDRHAQLNLKWNESEVSSKTNFSKLLYSLNYILDNISDNRISIQRFQGFRHRIYFLGGEQEGYRNHFGSLHGYFVVSGDWRIIHRIGDLRNCQRVFRSSLNCGMEKYLILAVYRFQDSGSGCLKVNRD